MATICADALDAAPAARKPASAVGSVWVAYVMGTLLFCLSALAAEPDSLAGSGETNPQDPIALGQRMYREGLLPSGEPMRATVQRDIPLSGAKAACVSCHRRSGLSSSEGPVFVPPASGRILYQPREIRRKQMYASRVAGPGTRPAYTDETLARAITDGIDPAGRALDDLMPRYDLSDEELAPLIAYLKVLSAEPSPGVTDEEMHFATVISDGVDEDEAKAMLDVLRTFFKLKNAESRHETRRAEHAPWYKDIKYQSYRSWVLHVWELTGPPHTWSAQLERHYERQPVFAMLGGLASGPWTPMHAFCERREIPCLFPITQLPGKADHDFYTFYFSRGLELEAQVLASYLYRTQSIGPEDVVLQIVGDDPHGRVAAKAFREAMRKHGFTEPRERTVGGNPLLTGDIWREYRPSVLVLWLTDIELEALAEAADVPRAIYLSSGLVEEGVELPAELEDRAYAIHPFVLPERHLQRLRGMQAWLRRQGIESSAERVQADAYFTVTLTARAVKHILDNFSRDYLIERIEHMGDNAPTRSVYPNISLGPNQRFASNGAYIVRIGADGRLTPVSDWIVP